MQVARLAGFTGGPYAGPQIRPEMLYQGDLIPEVGIGCSNPTGTSWIKAPGCGLSAWGTLDSIGYPGNWCMAVSAWAGVPSSTELRSWGSLKNEFKWRS